MKTIDLLQRIESLYSKGVQSDDSRLTYRHIYNKMLTVRSKLLFRKNKLNKNNRSIQYIDCIELIESSFIECECKKVPGYEVLRTKYKLPETLNIKYSYNVTSLDSSIVFDEYSWENKKYISGNKYSSKKSYFIEKNNYLYIINNLDIDTITVSAVFKDPSQVLNFPSPCCPTNTIENCISPLDMEFPIDSELEEDLVLFSVDELIKIFSANIEDITNNTRDNNQAK